MSKLPHVSARKAIRAFGRLGFVELRTCGSHVILKKDGHPYLLVVPSHGNADLKTGLLHSLIKASGHTVKEFKKAL
jgi:predicted RNA binding protein YcfA (HicA-like mRNA interferase family)